MTIAPLGDYEPEWISPERRTPRPAGGYAYPKIEAFIRYCCRAELVFKGQQSKGNFQDIAHFEPFCGPGWNQTKDGHRRFKGTPLRAVTELKHYNLFVFNDYDSDSVDCLYSELMDLHFDENPDVRVYLGAMDANEVVKELEKILPKRSGPPFPMMGTAIVDPEGLHFRWPSTVCLSRHKLDLLAMIPTNIDLNRNLKNPGSQDHLRAWLGEEPISDSPSEVVAQFERRLKTLYTNVHGPTTGGDAKMEAIWIRNRYHLIAASNCPNKVASNIWIGEVLRTLKQVSGAPLEGLGLG